MTTENSEFKKVVTKPDGINVGEQIMMYEFRIAETWKKIFALIDKNKTTPTNTNNEDNG